MKNDKSPKIRDLRDIPPTSGGTPGVADDLNGLKPLVKVDEPHIVTPGVDGEPAGQTTHE